MLGDVVESGQLVAAEMTIHGKIVYKVQPRSQCNVFAVSFTPKVQ